MGYDFRITRKPSWSDADGKVIQADEWLTLTSSIDELEPVSEVSVPSNWHPHHWQGHPEHRPIFELRSGNIVFRGADPATMGFALKLARALEARIVGEEDESYTLDEIVGSAGDLSSNHVNPFTHKPIFQERRGVVEFRNGESHLVSSRRTLFGLRKTADRALLHFVVAAPQPPLELQGGHLHVRGELSKPGAYGQTDLAVMSSTYSESSASRLEQCPRPPSFRFCG